MTSSITSKIKTLQNRGRQYGQSSVFVIVFLVITLLSLVFLYKAGKLTSEKMEMQNAADAAAYSVALIEARDLNFMSYTNRAMVANEVAIGQAVGLASMPRHWRSVGHYLDALCGARIEPIAQLLSAIPPAAPAGNFLKTTICTVIIRNVAKGFISSGKLLTTGMDNIVAKPIAAGMHISNRILSEAQTFVHFGTVTYVIKSISDVVDDNANDTAIIGNTDKKAQLSPYGLTLLLGHLKTFGSFDAYRPSGGKFTRTYLPNKNADAEGFERLSSIVGASRDEFTKERGWKLPIIPQIKPNIPAVTIPIIPDTLEIELKLKFELSLSINRRGASEHRFIGKRARGDKFNWSSADTTASQFVFFFEVSLKARVCDPTGIIGGCTDIATLIIPFEIRNNQLNLDPELIIDVPPIINDLTIEIPPGGIHLPFPVDVPYGAAGAQIGKTAITTRNARTYLNRLPNAGIKSYYQSPKFPESGSAGTNPHTMAWRGSPFTLPARGAGGPNFSCAFPPVNCTVPIVSKWLPNQRVNRSYSGLKKYTDTLNPKDLWGFEGPNNIIALQKSEDVLFTATATDPAGQFRLDEATAGNIMGSLAKGEVYFKRSTKISYFKREDGFEERGSAFNPYWQARLAPLSHADRALAAVQQHGENLEGSNLTPIPNATWAPIFRQLSR